jgi:hypothetical protein
MTSGFRGRRGCCRAYLVQLGEVNLNRTSKGTKRVVVRVEPGSVLDRTTDAIGCHPTRRGSVRRMA